MRPFEITGEEWPGGSGVFQAMFLSGPKVAGGLAPSAATPPPLGPRKRGQSADCARAAVARAKTSARERAGVRVLWIWDFRFGISDFRTLTPSLSRSTTRPSSAKSGSGGKGVAAARGRRWRAMQHLVGGIGRGQSTAPRRTPHGGEGGRWPARGLRCRRAL